MASKIQWTDDTWNPIRARNRETGGIGHFCEHVSEGCRNCYAERLQAFMFKNPVRFARQDRDKVEIFLDLDVLVKPLKWRRPRLIFVCSMTDLFGAWMMAKWWDRIFAVMAMTPQHEYRILTKRPDLQRRYITDPATPMRVWAAMPEVDIRWSGLPRPKWPLPNVMLGTSVEDQAAADKRIWELLATPAAAWNVSYEPALGPVDFTRCARPLPKGEVFPADAEARGVHGYVNALSGATGYIDHGRRRFETGSLNKPRLSQVIFGGESDGPGQQARPSHPDWARATRDACVDHGVDFFLKQWGAWTAVGAPVPAEAHGGRLTIVRPDGGMADPNTAVCGAEDAFMVRVGAKHAGNELDGMLWDQQPPFLGVVPQEVEALL